DASRARSMRSGSSLPERRNASWSDVMRTMSRMPKNRCRYISRASGNRLDPGSRVLSRSKNAASRATSPSLATIEPPAPGASPVGHEAGQDRERNLLRGARAQVDPDGASQSRDLLVGEARVAQRLQVRRHVPPAPHDADEPRRRAQ